MSYAPSSPVTGGAQSGFTSPTYTIASDTAPDTNAKQFYVSALGGTQTGVVSHSIAIPFTATMFRPKSLRILGNPDPVTGIVRQVPRNVFKHVVRKGVLPLTGQPYQTMVITTVIEVPAGADAADPANIRAGLSLSTGLTWQVASGLGDTLVSGVLG